jgi:hypothetical protein
MKKIVFILIAFGYRQSKFTDVRVKWTTKIEKSENTFVLILMQC